MPLRFNRTATIFALFLSSTLIPAAAQMSAKGKTSGKDFDNAAAEQAKRYLEEGRETFRFDTFGSEDFWGGKLKLHEAVAGEKLGGKGPGLSPEKALELGLKVDVNAIPTDVAEALNKGEVDLADPASTLVLLRANAVVGVTGFFAEDGKTLTSVGIQCAVCHSTVDDAYAPGIGHRLDGWPNRDLNIGAIVALAPDLTAFTEMLQISEAEVKKAVEAWGPGKFDAELNLDGKAFRPDGKTAATLNPPAFGLAGVNNHTWTGAWGTVSYWNAYVGNLEMHGKGVFYDPRLDDAEKYPVAARTKQGHKQDKQDRITAKLPALHFYQLSLPTPKPPEGAFDSAAAEKGEALFNDKAKCGTCHVPPLFTEPGWNLHTADEIGIDDFQAMRSPDERYRTASLRALWDIEKIHKGGFYHDGRFATLNDVVKHYDGHLRLDLTDQEKSDLIEYLKSI
ncbi:MAG: c-type cytochrome [Mesorhizobium sp.]|uniref:c-type cytochrome n=2 Tax=Mesorhizobium sp. TaxID=1871066 RepID=UPI000FE2F2CB|nr:c-type cytochrome [Mesorhizobium sp.]RWB02236.1 MAG: c-type cytochrome [Mesorhizobium sp.]RWB99643.1 MAG: c-type cytochrome [Mesorhizobium sp.]RWO10298.1 MAG: c-type cytochrome [Mesorhizobium sp.]RWO96374.1 MAG: c-type cytochrome [Mesorhizobium sp.]RWP08569.1 MAG: c-type cytochrome [Mesorhizobium sp.]